MFEATFAAIRNHKKSRPPLWPVNAEYERLRMDIDGQQKVCKIKQKGKHKAKV